MVSAGEINCSTPNNVGGDQHSTVNNVERDQHSTQNNVKRDQHNITYHIYNLNGNVVQTTRYPSVVDIPNKPAQELEIDPLDDILADLEGSQRGEVIEKAVKLLRGLSSSDTEGERIVRMKKQFPVLVSRLKKVLSSGPPQAQEDALNCVANFACYGKGQRALCSDLDLNTMLKKFRSEGSAGESKAAKLCLQNLPERNISYLLSYLRG